MDDVWLDERRDFDALFDDVEEGTDWAELKATFAAANRALDESRLEIARIEYERAMARIEARQARSDRKLKLDLEAIDKERDRVVAQARATLAAGRALDNLDRLPAGARRRASTLRLLCDSGCQLVAVYPRRLNGAGDLLIVTYREREASAVFAYGETRRTSLHVACRHGSADLDRHQLADLASRARGIRRVPTDTPGTTWLAKPQ